jgi:PAN domain
MNALLGAIQPLAIICVLNLSTVAYAAEITAPALHANAPDADPVWPTDPVLCDLVLDGDIKEGDATTLAKSFQAIVGSKNAFSFFFCLRSAGGDLREAVNMAQFVLRTQRPSIATVVEDGQTCASACAIIFMAGNAPARVGAFPQRFLHPRGRLLFHSSQLALGNFTEKQLLAMLTEPSADPRGLKGKIVDLYKDGLQDVQSVIATFQKLTYQREDLGDRWVRPSLFLEMFAQDPEEWICIDNVDTVGRWNVQVFGYKNAKQLQKQNYVNLCTNAYYWRADRFADEGDDLELTGELATPPLNKKIAGRTKTDTLFERRVTLPFQAPFQPLTCVIEFYDAKSSSEGALKAFLVNSAESASGGFPDLAPFAFHPANLPLPDLPGLRPPPATAAGRQPPSEFKQYANSMMNGCSYKRIQNLDPGSCEAACATDKSCRGYSQNKVTQACELKHTMTSLRADPFWTSGVPSAGNLPKRSARASSMADWNRKSAKGNDLRISGRLIDTIKVEGDEAQDACFERCRSEPRCVAVEFGATFNDCRRFEEVNGATEQTTKEQYFLIQIKKQQ